MFNTKLLASILLVLAVIFAQVGNAAAAPQTQEGTTTTISGTITKIEIQTDENGDTIVAVTLEGYQPISLSAQEAADNDLFDLATQELLVQEGDPVELVVDPNDVIPDEEPTEPDVHLISELLANFFFDGDSEMASLIDSFHTGDNEAEQVFGFGVIAQALWMSQSFTEDGTADATLAEQILAAKKSGEYDNITLSDGTVFEWPDGNVPANWGQFKKGLRENKEKHNLGVIVSGQADDGTEDALNAQGHGNGKNKKDKKDKNPHRP